MEAFVGVLYSGFCGSVLVSKMSGLFTQACITLSSCMCVQFGEGVTEADVTVPIKLLGKTKSVPPSCVKGGGESGATSTDSPFPVLAFRFINNVSISSSFLLQYTKRL